MRNSWISWSGFQNRFRNVERDGERLIFRHSRKNGGSMNICRLLLVLLLLGAVGPMGQAQDSARPEAAQQDAPSSPPARRPKLPGDIIFESSLGDVLFPHKVHRRMGCQKCHHQIRAKDLKTPHDEYLSYSWVTCRDCHDESRNPGTYYGCAKCHHSNLENIADETLSSKVVLHKNCWKCHLSGTGAEASERCGFCHLKEQQPVEVTEGSADPEAESGTTRAAADREPE